MVDCVITVLLLVVIGLLAVTVLLLVVIRDVRVLYSANGGHALPPGSL